MFQWLPKTRAARLYFALVYGVLLPWFVICFMWGSVLKGPDVWPIAVWPIALQYQVMKILALLWLPPLAGMGIDLLIAKWTDRYHRPTIQAIGVFALLTVAFFTLPEIMRYYILA